jgi:hypothetical protein
MALITLSYICKPVSHVCGEELHMYVTIANSNRRISAFSKVCVNLYTITKNFKTCWEKFFLFYISV